MDAGDGAPVDCMLDIFGGPSSRVEGFSFAGAVEAEDSGAGFDTEAAADAFLLINPHIHFYLHSHA
jgi:hypothetical protein